MNVFKNLLITTLLGIILLSCVHVNREMPKIVSESFTYLTMHVTLEICGPTKGYGFRCLKLEPSKYSASGSVVRHIKENSYVLTAGHFCDINREKVIKQIVDPAMIETLFENVKEVKINVIIEVLDGNGFSKTAKVVDKNALLDTCVLETDRIDVKAIKLAAAPPVYGETVWNIASPLGIVIPKGVPILKGIYSGDAKLNGGRTVSIITDLPAVPGCSGSPVLNTRGEMIAMIYATNRNFIELSYAVNLRNIRDYLDYVFVEKNRTITTKNNGGGTTTLEVEEPKY